MFGLFLILSIIVGDLVTLAAIICVTIFHILSDKSDKNGKDL